MSASKRDELVRKALTAFYRDGFGATGMDKLVGETGVGEDPLAGGNVCTDGEPDADRDDADVRIHWQPAPIAMTYVSCGSPQWHERRAIASHLANRHTPASPARMPDLQS